MGKRQKPGGNVRTEGDPAVARARLKSLGLKPGDSARNPDGWWEILESQEDEHGHDYKEARHLGREDLAEAMLTPVNREVQRLFEHDEAPGAVTQSDAKTLYFKHHENGDDERFVRDGSRAYDVLLSIVGDLPLEEYTRGHALKLRDALLEAGNKTTTVRRRLNPLTAMFNNAKREHGLNIVNPFDKIDIPRERADAEKRPTFSLAQFRTIAAACHATDDQRRHILAIQLDTGARLSEVIGLRIEDVFLDHAAPPHRPKADEPRRVCRRLPLLRGWRHDEQDDEQVFT